ncbi:MAG: phosphoribosylamine--glycine ligase [Treponema sp.]|nr:phosphoribosylamine--glycine ligase [Treponema sp.]
MNVLIVGSGGREHALAWKLARSPRVERVYVAPGNGGTDREPKCRNLVLGADPASSEGIDALLDAARKEDAAFTLVGPEAPLAAGIVDRFRAEGLPILGPDRRAAQLEASKVWSKAFMERYGVRTGFARTFEDYEEALRAIARHWAADNPPPLVIKADGLAAGKGVVVAASQEAAGAALSAFMRDGALGDAGKRVLIEEFIEGREVSVLAAVSAGPAVPGRGVILPFVSARDHKARFEGGKGPNTGGMGAIAPVPDFSAGLCQDFQARILEPSLRGIEAEGLDYRGFIFFGLMIREGRCYLLEYNVRLGDPETQAVLPLMDTDLAELCGAVLGGRLGDLSLAWKAGAVSAPVAVAEGYPGPYRRGDLISVDKARLERTGARLFMAGAASGADGELVTSGGRVLSASAWGANPAEARERAYAALDAVSFTGKGFRRDIGAAPSAYSPAQTPQ